MFRELRDIILHRDGTVSYLRWWSNDWASHVTEVPLEHLAGLPRMAQVAIVRHLGMEVDLDNLPPAPPVEEPRPVPVLTLLSVESFPRVRIGGRPKRQPARWRRRRHR